MKSQQILPIVKEWQERPLEEVYAVVFMDAIHYHVRSEGRIVKRAVYIALGIDMNGKKDVLGMYVGENESAKFWHDNWATLSTYFKYPEAVSNYGYHEKMDWPSAGLGTDSFPAGNIF